MVVLFCIYTPCGVRSAFTVKAERTSQSLLGYAKIPAAAGSRRLACGEMRDEQCVVGWLSERKEGGATTSSQRTTPQQHGAADCTLHTLTAHIPLLGRRTRSSALLPAPNMMMVVCVRPLPLPLSLRAARFGRGAQDRPALSTRSKRPRPTFEQALTKHSHCTPRSRGTSSAATATTAQMGNVC